jgi:hypothetical protein
MQKMLISSKKRCVYGNFPDGFRVIYGNFSYGFRVIYGNFSDDFKVIYGNYSDDFRVIYGNFSMKDELNDIFLIGCLSFCRDDFLQQEDGEFGGFFFAL